MLAGARAFESERRGDRVERVDAARRSSGAPTEHCVGRRSSAGLAACVRIAGRRSKQVGARLRELLGFVPALLGDDPWARKW